MSKKNGRYNVPRKTCVLVLTGDYEGAEARCRLDVGMGTYLTFQRLTASQEPDQLEEACRSFGDDVLSEWNLEDEGQAIPATGDGFLMIPPALATAMIQAWSEAMSGLPAPLGEGSPSSAEDSREPSMPESV